MASITAPSVTVCGHHLSAPRHVCCFFDSRDQQYDVLLPYFREGLANGEQVLCITEGHHVCDHHQRLAAGGIEVDCQVPGQLQVALSDDTYLDGGAFDKGRMFGLLQQKLADIASSPFTGLRTCGDMDWALRNMPGTEELMEYENDINALLEGRSDVTFLCVYDANRITGRAMMDILSTHSHVIIGTTVHENQYCMKPADFRRTILARRNATTEMLGVSLKSATARPPG